MSDSELSELKTDLKELIKTINDMIIQFEILKSNFVSEQGNRTYHINRLGDEIKTNKKAIFGQDGKPGLKDDVLLLKKEQENRIRSNRLLWGASISMIIKLIYDLIKPFIVGG